MGSTKPLSTTGPVQSFDGEERARVFAAFFEQGSPMWAAMGKLAEAELSAPPRTILDVGTGPGEPACHFASKFQCPTLATDVAASMVELAKKRAAAKGLAELVKCQLMDATDMSALADASQDLVIGQMVYQFLPDKPAALREALRVLKPGGLMVANVWVAFDLITMAGGIMAAVKGPPPQAPPPPNPNSPLGLADASLFDGLLEGAGFEFTGSHNTEGSIVADLGAPDSDQAFKMTALPLWDALTGLQDSGEVPDAWARAQAAFPGVAAPFVGEDGLVSLNGTYRIAVARKPAP
eukprot:CAMPEP_0182914086 /NCGR_PEP_ID=MMETSP0034_2-20130328/38369_1 /TAXON_ID=156128 /ORGANISM="Nephroselmis pyriformis, Strain CCMP717" /LENGTH=293 /DNA_ID=CAMNT_0025050819 /DNA_START=50 /DNA_END=931 /DNA_ORIENTATION=-